MGAGPEILTDPRPEEAPALRAFLLSLARPEMPPQVRALALFLQVVEGAKAGFKARTAQAIPQLTENDLLQEWSDEASGGLDTTGFSEDQWANTPIGMAPGEGPSLSEELLFAEQPPPPSVPLTEEALPPVEPAVGEEPVGPPA